MILVDLLHVLILINHYIVSRVHRVGFVHAGATRRALVALSGWRTSACNFCCRPSGVPEFRIEIRNLVPYFHVLRRNSGIWSGDRKANAKGIIVFIRFQLSLYGPLVRMS